MTTLGSEVPVLKSGKILAQEQVKYFRIFGV